MKNCSVSVSWLDLIKQFFKITYLIQKSVIQVRIWNFSPKPGIASVKRKLKLILNTVIFKWSFIVDAGGSTCGHVHSCSVDCSLLAPQQGHSMRKVPSLDASRAPIRTIPHSRSCYGTPNAVPTLAPTPTHLMSHNRKMITDCFLTDSTVAEIKGGCWPERASSLLCCSARMLSALVDMHALAAWVEPGNRGPDLAAGPDYARADLAS